MNPQHPILNAITGELAQAENGEGIESHSVREGKDVANNDSSMMDTQDITPSDQECKIWKRDQSFYVNREEKLTDKQSQWKGRTNDPPNNRSWVLLS